MRTYIGIIIAALVVSVAPRNEVLGSYPSAAQSACATVHVVQSGEWLALIARSYGTTISELIRLNPWLAANPDLIFPGTRLCITVAPLPSPTAPPSARAQVVLEAVYQYIPVKDDRMFELHSTTWRFSKQIALPLQAINSVEFLTQTEQLTAALFDTPQPRLVVLSNETLPEVPQTYTLYEVYQGDAPKILPTLQISTTRPITIAPGIAGATPLDTLEVNNASAVTMTLSLEVPSGMRLPFAITRLGMIAESDIGTLNRPGRLALYVLPATTGQPGEYQLKARLSENGIGPNGSRLRWGCYYDYGGWNYYFLWQFFGCSRGF